MMLSAWSWWKSGRVPAERQYRLSFLEEMQTWKKETEKKVELHQQTRSMSSRRRGGMGRGRRRRKLVSPAAVEAMAGVLVCLVALFLARETPILAMGDGSSSSSSSSVPSFVVKLLRSIQALQNGDHVFTL